MITIPYIQLGLSKAATVQIREIRNTRTSTDEESGMLKDMYIVALDFHRIFDTEQEALDAFALFDKDEDEEISRHDLKHAVIRIFKERKNVLTALSDTENALGRLDAILKAIVVLICVFILMMLFNVVPTVIISAFGSIVVALAVFCGNSAKNLFDSIIFVFVFHPYDTGDRVFIKLPGSMNPENLMIHKVHLMTTHFRRWDGSEIYVANSILAQLPIHNARRSGDQWDSFKIDVDFADNHDRLENLKMSLQIFLKENSADYYPTFHWWVKSMDSTGVKISVEISYQHKATFQDSWKRWARRDKFIGFMKKALKDTGVNYQIPVQTISVIKQNSAVLNNWTGNEEVDDKYSESNLQDQKQKKSTSFGTSEFIISHTGVDLVSKDLLQTMKNV
ncbi:hypothetical protein HK096_006140 [Nowakowskiella sp. JEL0078]|nr:hypothetical protein HK096_006140 [Nowakowskiella sp. JEL0078]